MFFSYPLFLYFLAFLSIPVILSIIKFKKKESVFFSSIDILKKIYNKRKKILRIQNFLLLLLRLLIIILLVLLFANINFKQNIQTGFANLFSLPDVVVLVDNSLSMSYKETDGARFENLKNTLIEFVNNNLVKKDILINQIYKPSPFIKANNKTELYDIIDSLYTTKYVQNISVAINNMENELLNKNIILFTDNYASYKDYENINFSLYKSFNLVKLTEEDGVNISIKNVINKNYFNTLNLPYLINVIIENYNYENILSLPVYMYNYDISNKSFEINQIQYVDVNSFSEKTVDFTVDSLEKNKLLKFAIPNDKLDFDNNYYFVLQPHYNYKALVNNINVYNNFQTLMGSSKFFLSDSQFNNEYDIFILSADDFTENWFTKYKNLIQKGLRVIIYTNNDMDINRWNNLYRKKDFQYDKIIPGIVRGKVYNEQIKTINFSHPVSLLFYNNILFELNPDESFKISPLKDSLSLINYDDNSSLLTEISYGNGKLVLIGIDLSNSNNYENVSLIPALMQIIDYYGTENYYQNHLTFQSGNIILEEEYASGIYENENNYYAENLLRVESRLNQKKDIPEQIDIYNFEYDEVETKINYFQHKDSIIIFLIIILIIFERLLVLFNA